MAIVITAKRDGFRRCGIAHSRKPTSYPDDFFTEEQWRALLKEPQLILAYVEDEFDQVKDGHNEILQEVDVSKASGAAQNAQSQTLEAIATALGNGVALPITPVTGSGEPGPDGSGSGPNPPVIEPSHDQSSGFGIDFDALWEDALQEDQAREAAKAEALKPPTKPRKTKSEKTEDEGK
ncbi:hypothetical protein SAMN05216178_3939 [Pseudomonas saponiphila]|uniref:Mu-like prophage FluMu N-terminal domain-containing protein n=1 Tax=Pseudomonas saponiphila TaxID=556534 RepID=A0A1H4QW94_9PSED|nr:HI1506-related protein [Pseudomonas saponiphila]SEC23905.1 hypothetical protein SAMN05216178_3939 [Pseudomonas saponiphila]